MYISLYFPEKEYFLSVSNFLHVRKTLLFRLGHRGDSIFGPQWYLASLKVENNDKSWLIDCNAWIKDKNSFPLAWKPGIIKYVQ